MQKIKTKFDYISKFDLSDSEIIDLELLTASFEKLEKDIKVYSIDLHISRPH